MIRETVVRQNRCDQEMNFLVFLCFSLYFAIQLLGESVETVLFQWGSLLLYLIFVPAFFSMCGYRIWRLMANCSWEYCQKNIRKLALHYYGMYLILGTAKLCLQNGFTLRSSFLQILFLQYVPSTAAIFLSLALLLLLVSFLREEWKKHLADYRVRILFTILSLLTALITFENGCYTSMSLFLRSAQLAGVPILPYLSYVMLGILCWEKKPGFQWKLLGISGILSAVSALLYFTPLWCLGRITISICPVYLLYVFAEVLFDATLRWKTVRVVCDRVELTFAAYAALLFGCLATGFTEGADVRRILLIAAAAFLSVYLLVILFVLFCEGYTMLMEYLNRRIRHKLLAYFVIYTIAFAGILCLVFFYFLKTGRTFIWIGDGVSQYYPRAIYYSRYIRSFLSNLFCGKLILPMYDFTIGLGCEVVYSLEPLYLLFAIFGENHAELAYNLTILLRFYLSGISVSILLLYFKKDYYTTFLSSLVYVFCGFSLFAGIKHTMFMIPMIMLPLLILSIEEIIRKRRWYLCTIFVAISLLSNYYFLYMNTIAMGVYFLVRFFCQKEKKDRTLKAFFARGLTICGTYLLGVGMSCIVLVTTFGLYVGSGRNGDIKIKTPSLFFYRQSWILRIIQTFLTYNEAPGEWLKLGFLPITLLALVILFRKKGRKELKYFSLIGFLFMILPVCGFVFSGFSSVINRWCYMLSLLLAYIVADCYDDLLHMTLKDFAACLGVTAIFTLIVYYVGYDAGGICNRYTKLSTVLLFLTLVILILCHDANKKVRNRTKQCMMALLTVSILFIQSYCFYALGTEGKEYARPGVTEEENEATPLLAITELEDDSFFRAAPVSLPYYTSNEAMLAGYNSVSMVCSALNGSIMSYFAQLGNISYSQTQLLGFDNRLYLSTLAAVKYYASYEDPSRAVPYGCRSVLETTVNDRKVTVYENEYALPLGYTYSEAISESELEENYTVAERSEVMLQKVVLSDGEESSGTEGIQIQGERLEILSTKEKGIHLTENSISNEKTEEDEDSGGPYTLTLKIKSQPNAETYLVLKNAWMEGDMTEGSLKIEITTEDNKISYSFKSDDNRYATGQSDYVFNLGYHEESLKKIKIRFRGRRDTIHFEDFYVYSQSMDGLKDYTDARKEDVLENVTVGTNTVSGTISLTEKKYLVLSIPYQNGWTAYVDGQKAQLLQANTMYMALALEPGEHTIELHYEIPHIKIALLLMLGSSILFLLLMIIHIVRWHKKKKLSLQKEM